MTKSLQRELQSNFWRKGQLSGILFKVQTTTTTKHLVQKWQRKRPFLPVSSHHKPIHVVCLTNIHKAVSMTVVTSCHHHIHPFKGGPSLPTTPPLRSQPGHHWVPAWPPLRSDAQPLCLSFSTALKLLKRRMSS